MTNEMKLILDKLDSIHIEIDYIKKHMVDADSVLTEGDYKSLVEYRKEKSSGKLVSHEQLKKELGL